VTAPYVVSAWQVTAEPESAACESTAVTVRASRIPQATNGTTKSGAIENFFIAVLKAERARVRNPQFRRQTLQHRRKSLKRKTAREPGRADRCSMMFALFSSA